MLEDAFKLGFSRDQKQVYRDFKPFWDNEALQQVKQGRKPLDFEQLLTVDSHEAHLAMVRDLAETARLAIVIAGNGMCTSGRIVNCLKSMLSDPRHYVLFVGYQPRGSAGRTIQAYGPRGGNADLDGQRCDIRAQIHTIGGYSAHADQKGRMYFFTRMREWLSEVRIVHGEPAARNIPAKRLQGAYANKRLPLQVTIPS